jgi:putative ABC transport system substrate-binding protein
MLNRTSADCSDRRSGGHEKGEPRPFAEGRGLSAGWGEGLGAGGHAHPALGHSTRRRRCSSCLRISFSSPAAPRRRDAAKTWLAAFEEGLQKLGWGQGRNVRIDYRWGRGEDQRLRTYAAELVRAAPDVLFAASPLAVVALHRETRSLPIVYVQVSDPIKLGFVATLARPGGNVTGFTTFEYSIVGKWLELIKDTAPRTTRVAVIFDPSNPAQALYVQAIEASTPSFGMQLTLSPVRDAAEVERAVDAFAEQPNGALLVTPNAVTLLQRDLIIALAARHHLPAVYPYRFFATAGGFMSYGIDLAETYRRAASYVDLILKGAKPGDLPVQLSAKFELVVNLKVAKALGLTIPEPFLQRADEVIE